MRLLHTNLSMLLTCLAVATTSADVGAQGAEADPAADPAATPDGTPGDTAEAPPEEPAADPRETASKAYREGRAAFEAGEFDRALELFRSSHQVHQSPNSRLMIAKTLHELGQPVEAYKEMVAAEQEAVAAAKANDAYIDTLNAAREVLAQLRSGVAVMRVTVVGGHTDLPPGSSISINGLDLPTAEWGEPIALAPGATTITLTTIDGVTEQTLSLAAGDDQATALERPVADTPVEPEGDGFGEWFEENRETAAFVAGGVGAAGLITFAIFGGMTLSSYGDLDDSCPGGNCPTGSQDDIDSGQTYQTVANVGLVVGLVGAAASATLFLLPTILGSDDDTEAARRRLPLTVGIGPGSLTIGGSF